MGIDASTTIFAIIHAAAWTSLFIQLPCVVQSVSRRHRRDAARSESGYKDSEGLFTDHDINRAQADSLALYHAFKDCKDEFLAKKLQSAMSTLSDALRLYGPDQLFASYNGGKDADVTMYLLLALTANYSAEKGVICRPKLIYFAIDDEFQEVLTHIKDAQMSFALNLVTYSGDIVRGITQHIDDLSANGLNAPAFMLGTRRGDPNSADQQAFSPSSEWMPAFMRVNPILDWDYAHVWHFLRLFQLPYCSLYDVGYTSLGKKSDTQPNPALRHSKADTDTSASLAGEVLDDGEYWPAYMLSDASQERAGRGKRGH